MSTFRDRAGGPCATAALAIVAGLCVAGQTQAGEVIRWSFPIDGGQEVPPNSSPAYGIGHVTIDTNRNTLTYNITFGGLVGANETAAHIHGFAPPGQNAGVQHPLPLGDPKIGVWNYPEASEQQILQGLTYVNIHSTDFPGGEIRGQIVCVGPVIDDFQPQQARQGEIVTITGNGFDPDPDNMCVMSLDPDGQATTMVVIASSPQQMQVVVEQVDPNAQPGQLMVEVGEGSRGTFVPVRQNIFFPGNDNWRWKPTNRLGGVALQPFIPIPDPPPPQNTRWWYGEVVNGKVCIIIDGSWAPNTESTISGRLRRFNAVGENGGDIVTGSGTVYHTGGTAIQCACDICDHIACVFQQVGGGPPVRVQCTKEELPGNEAKITICLIDEQTGQQVPIQGGTLKICAVTQVPVPIFGRDHYALGGATIEPDPQGRLKISNLGSSGCDGVSIDLGDDGPPREVAIELVALSLQSVEPVDLGLHAWGHTLEQPDDIIHFGDAGVRNVPGANILELFADYAKIGSDLIRVEVYSAGAFVGAATVPGGGVLGTLEGQPLIEGCGKVRPDPPCFFIDLDRDTAFFPNLPNAGPIVGDEVRMLAANAQVTIGGLKVFDITGRSLPEILISGESIGSVSETVCPDDPNDFFKQFGGGVTGDASRLCADDKTRLEVVQSAQLSPLLPFIRLDYWAHTSFADGVGVITSLEYHINCHVSALVGGGQNPDTLRTRIRNYATNGYELVDQRGTSFNSDEDIVHVQNTNASDYVQPGDGEIRVRQEVFSPGNVFSPNWSLKVDLYEVLVTQ